MVAEAMRFISSLEFTLRNGLPQEKLIAIRQCIARIWVDAKNNKVKIRVRTLPVSDFQQTEELFYEMK